ncbi:MULTISPECIES: VOC family protein [unclassified Chelatococcus]|uniref:VOC family protein n=1 Tax=unclassified Chelatococcus TaxID=2638111 RepID=UPI001BCB2F58|nr:MULTISPECIES: VOC family protein [unclassified Chelatococcus]CAH1648475.1 Catechol-2,3-dioxygenase [Hyphomicrobiales bacterium]MBS7741933.1 VOC family protein [Chelatococcus sp. HY11]MBX3541269.1 VOC family protein [Chelatococcus sp.]MCO5074838.1 VOC family protein [Chelatococcus sp.]CAH1691063.1 Catechol-2,3-dioxygenase [Hyphomicrobiales bacterium]
MTTPSTLAMGRVALTVNDLDGVSAFYQRAVGLHLLRGNSEMAELGAGDAVLLELRRDKAARRRTPREAGLFHTAFLLPTRADLGRWARNAGSTRTPVVGASDHDVSEAIYLSDPEGNGVEIYADRPAGSWHWTDGVVAMSTKPLDIEGLVASAGDEAWRGFPEGAKVGHVHLQVGALPPAEAFYSETLGLDITCRYQGGTFYAADGYHHHIATNIWNSRGATERSYPSTGLADFEIHVAPSRLAAVSSPLGCTNVASPAHLDLRDPWGTAITLLVR